MNNARSISTEILLIVFLASTLSLAGSGVFQYHRNLTDARRDLQLFLEQQTNRLSHSLVYPAWNLNQEEIEKCIGNEMFNNATMAIFLHNEEGRLVAGRIKGPNNKVVPYTDSEPQRRLLKESTASESKLVVKNNITIGTVQVHVTENHLKSEQREFLRYIILQLAILSVAISFTIYYFLKRRIIAPINALESSVRSISADNLSPSIAIARNDEIGRLSASFNFMGEALQGSFSQQQSLTEELRKREEQLRAIAANLPGAIFRIEGPPHDKIVFVSDYIFTIAGLPASHFIGASREDFRQIIVAEDRGLVELAEHRAISTRSSYDIKFRITDAQDRIRWVHEIGQCSGCGDEYHVDGVLIDETELHEKSLLLVQSQKMETVGVLAGGIAHDFNNILGGIVGAVSMVKKRFPLLSDSSQYNLDHYLSVIENSSLRASNMTRQLLALSKPQEVAMSHVDLRECIGHVVEICRNTFDKSVTLITELADEPAMILGDAMQIEQVLLNLCVNASHALTIMRTPSEQWGGTVHLSLRRSRAHADSLPPKSSADENDYWVLEVTDNGVGMDFKTISNIFTPFFTTKMKGTGTGLGLAMAYTIINQHNGFIRTHSEPGSGSSFRVFIPASAWIADAVTVDAARVLPAIGGGTVLVVDDEPDLREYASDVLADAGYRVITAENGAEAIRYIETLGAEIGVVFLDMIMPVLSGRETYYRIRERSPQIKIILTSGNYHDSRVQELIHAGVDAFIAKPYTIDDLSDAVGRLITGKESTPLST